MRKPMLYLLSSALAAVGMMGQAEAALIRIENPQFTVGNRQPLEAIVADGYGNIYRDIVYFDPSVGGIDLNIDRLGPNASIYIPALNVRYILFNGYWVDESGYYWNGTRRVFINRPDWGEYWNQHWHMYPQGGWHQEGWHEGGWRDGWRNRDFDDRQWEGRYRDYDRRIDGRYERQGNEQWGGWRRGDRMDQVESNPKEMNAQQSSTSSYGNYQSMPTSGFRSEGYQSGQSGLSHPSAYERGQGSSMSDQASQAMPTAEGYQSGTYQGGQAGASRSKTYETQAGSLHTGSASARPAGGSVNGAMKGGESPAGR